MGNKNSKAKKGGGGGGAGGAGAPGGPATAAATEAGTLSVSEIKNNRTASAIVRDIQEDPNVGRYLKDVPLLAKLCDSDRAKLGGAVVLKVFKDGEAIFKQGDAGKGFYIIHEGAVEVLVEHTDTKEMSEVARLKAGDYFGETSLLTNEPRAATIKAVGPVKTYFLDKVKFEALFTENRIQIDFAKRRVAISAEQMLAGAKQEDFKASSDRVMSDVTKKLILGAIHDNVLFQNLDEAHQLKVIQIMYPVEVKAGKSAIVEGEVGNNFFVIESGQFEVFVSNKETGKVGKVADKGPGSCFGELALLYNAPRAATVTATTDAVIWAVDRYTFRRIARDLGEKRLNQYIEFMHGVELLSPLAEYERAKLAEALEEVSFLPGQVIFQQGSAGDDMFIVADGEAIVTKKDADGKDEGEVALLRIGDYFGERAILKSEPRAATVSAKTRLHCLKVDRSAFNLLLGPLEDIMKKKVESYDVRAAKEETLVTWLRDDIKMEDLKVLGTLGKGSFGHVQLVQWKTDGTAYALKAVSKAQIVETRQQGHILSEKRVLSTLKHPFIIRLYATYKDKDRLYFLLEPSLGGELFTVLRKNRLFPEPTAKFYAASVILAFDYMHSLDTVYRDLKPENLLLDSEGYLKVTDFGFAKKIKAKTWTLCGTPEYLSPEIVAGKGHGKGVDWWTVGVLIFEMLASFTPFYHDDHMHMYARIARGKIKFPQHFSKDAKTIVKALLNILPSKRLGVIQGGAVRIKEQPWFKGFSFDDLFNHKMKAPIKPKIKNNTDISNFDDYSNQHHDDVKPYVDDGTNWDKDF